VLLLLFEIPRFTYVGKDYDYENDDITDDATATDYLKKSHKTTEYIYDYEEPQLS
jgi:hypothetical protein